MEYDKNQKYMIVSELAPWYSAREIEEITGMSQGAVARYRLSYGIPPMRDNKKEVWRSFEQERDAYWDERRKYQKHAIKEYLNGNKNPTL
tara:strand:- start:219 stop:488 length:270 start_codon:yes stop_codon:yes gene_type:complete